MSAAGQSRSLTGLLELLTELHAKKVDLFLHQQGLDTSTPRLARGRQAGTHLGRKFTEDTKEGSRKIKAALAMRAKGAGYPKIAKEVGLGVGTVMRLTAAQENSGPFEAASVAVA